jgi:hypothetical protein
VELCLPGQPNTIFDSRYGTCMSLNRIGFTTNFREILQPSLRHAQHAITILNWLHYSVKLIGVPPPGFTVLMGKHHATHPGACIAQHSGCSSFRRDENCVQELFF